tara:strand:+ start:191 stop:727 length:537 start_codon:yes stop_codon:yes gene_type:complete
MNAGDIWCSHEWERDVIDATSLDDVSERMLDFLESKYHEYAGNCSSGLLSFGRFQFPLVIIHRNWDDVEMSIHRAMAQWGVPPEEQVWDRDQLMEAHERVVTVNPEALNIDFEEAITPQGLAKIQNHCCPLMLPQNDRFKELCRHRVLMKEFDYPRAENGNAFGIPDSPVKAEHLLWT